MNDIRTKAGRDDWLEDEVTVRIGAQIRTQRQARGWSQSELASRCGIHQATISHLENLKRGDNPPSSHTLERIAAAFDIGLLIGFRPWSSVSDAVPGERIPEFEADSAS